MDSGPRAIADEAKLGFTLHGGRAEVVLILDQREIPATVADIPLFHEQLKSGLYGRVLEAIAGPETNDVDVPVRWNLRRHRGARLRLFLIDALTGPWGFVSMSEVKSTETRVEKIQPDFIRGDSNGDGTVDLSDAVHVLGHLFLGTPGPACLDASDANDSGEVDLSDAVSILGYLYLGTRAPPSPGPKSCGRDATLDGLDCSSYPFCGG